MSFSSDAGYVPPTIEAIMLELMDGVNEQFGTAYTAETFEGTNFYKYFYALAQKVQENEIKTSEIFVKIQDYFALTNESIARPVTTNPGLLARLTDAGYIASIKPPLLADAGKLYVAVSVDETAPTYAATKLAINTILKDSTVAGVVTQGDQTSSIVLSNGQSFDFKFKLPNRHTVLLRLTITLSDNNQSIISSPDDVKLALFANIASRYSLGKNFEPQKYFSVADAPWAESVLLEWSINGGSTWSSGVYNANYDDLFVVLLQNITLIEA